MNYELNTLEALQREFNGPTAPLTDVATKYLGITSRKAAEMAKQGVLPFPAHKLGSRKSPWMVSLADLADHIDKAATAARTDWEAQQ